MMKKLLLTILALAAVAAAGAAFLFNTRSGQDLTMDRVLTRTMAAAASQPASFEGLQVVVCGSASPLGASMDRAQACIAVVTPEHFFLFDVGARSPVRINQARLPVERLTGVFLTHYHSDHIAALPDVNLASWVRGRPGPLMVYGPQGVERVVNGMNAAYELDRQYRTAHHGPKLLNPDRGFMTPKQIPTDGVVWEDDRLKITAFTVDHPPIEPAVGYRVDYRGRSVVVSGDSNPSQPLFRAAAGADLVLHDALSRSLLDPMISAAERARLPVMPQIMNDVIDYHAESRTLVEQAEAAGIGQLVLYHLVPAPPNALAAKVFRRDLPDHVILAKDLHRFDLPAESTALIVHEP